MVCSPSFCPSRSHFHHRWCSGSSQSFLLSDAGTSQGRKQPRSIGTWYVFGLRTILSPLCQHDNCSCGRPGPTRLWLTAARITSITPITTAPLSGSGRLPPGVLRLKALGQMLLTSVPQNCFTQHKADGNGAALLKGWEWGGCELGGSKPQRSCKEALLKASEH